MGPTQQRCPHSDREDGRLVSRKGLRVMREPDPSVRFMRASIAANTRWAHEPDRASATSAGRAAFNERFENEVDPDRTLTPTERTRRADSARRAYFMRLALKSAQARRRTAGARSGGLPAGGAG